MSNPDDAVLMAVIGAAHGIRGEVRVQSFTADPEGLTAYGPLYDTAGRHFTIRACRPAKGMLIIRFDGVDDRNAAEALTGTELFIDRDRLRDDELEEDEFFHADLIGLAAVEPAGGSLGRVVALHDFGAGDLLEIRPEKGPTFMVPFTKATVPEVDVKGGRVVVDRPPEIETRDHEAGESGSRESAG